MKKLYKLALALTMILSAFPIIGNVNDNVLAKNVNLEDYTGDMTLPEGYTRYEYITSDGWQALNTGVTIDDDKDYEFELRFMPTEGASYYRYRAIFGTQYLSESYNFHRLLLDCNTMLALSYYNTSWSNNISHYFAYNKWYDYHLSKSGECTNNVFTSFYPNTEPGLKNNNEMLLFHQILDPEKQGFCGSISYFKIWEDNKLILYYVPCSSNTSEIGMYDMIGKKFVSNIRTGSFTGKIYNHSHEDYSNLLPTNYIPVNYVSGNSSPLDSGICGNNDNLNFEIDWQVPNFVQTASPYWPTIFGNYQFENYNTTRFYYNTKTLKILFNINGAGSKGPTNGDYNNALMDASRHTTMIGKSFGFIHDGTTLIDKNTLSSIISNPSKKDIENNENIKIFYSGYSRIYRFKIYDDSEGLTLLRDYVPVFNIFANECGLYDLITSSYLTGYGLTYENCPFCALRKNEITYSSNDGQIIRSENNVLYLPSNANYSEMPKMFEDGTVLSGPNGQLTVSGSSINFTTLFEEMVPGMFYSFTALINERSFAYSLIKSANISSLFIDLDGDLDIINADNVRKKDHTLKGNLNLYSKIGSKVSQAEISKFKGRGNWSWESSSYKKPYNITLKSKQDLIGCGTASKKWCLINHGGSYFDTQADVEGRWTGVNFAIWNDVFSSMNPAQDIDYEWIDLYVNNEYRGNYFLMESINDNIFDISKNNYDVEDKNCTTRVIQSSGVGLDTSGDDVPDQGAFYGAGEGGSDDLPLIHSVDIKNPTQTVIMENSEDDSNDIAINSGIQAYQYSTSSQVSENGYGGFIIEFARNYYCDVYNEACWFITRKGQMFSLKSPNYAAKEQVQTIAKYVQEMEDALFAFDGFNSFGNYYADYIDLESFAKQYAIHTIYGDADFCESSTFLYADVRVTDGLITTPLMGDIAWDLQSTGFRESFICHDYSSYKNFRCGFYAEQFLTHGDFVTSLYEVTKDGSNFKNSLEEMLDGGYEKIINSVESSLKMDTSKYNTNVGAYSSYKARLLSDLNKRYNYWYNRFFNPTNNLLGVTLSRKNGTLIANVTANSNHGSFKWYKVNDDGTYSEILGQTGQTYSPSQPGKYVVATNGGNLAELEPYGYDSPILVNDTITMVSNPFEYRAALYSSDYDSLTLALAATTSGDTLIIDKDYADADAVYVVKDGVDVDLFGSKVINALSFVSNGQIYDSKKDKGIIEADTYLFSSNQIYLPIFDTIKGGYSFFNVLIEDQVSANGKLQFRMDKDSLECNAALDLIGDDISGSRVKAQVSVTYTKDDGAGKTTKVTETFTFNDEWMEYIIFGAGKDPVKTYKRVLNFTIGNLSELEIVGDLYMQCSFVTYCGETAICSVKGTKWKTSDLGQTWVIGD